MRIPVEHRNAHERSHRPAPARPPLSENFIEQASADAAALNPENDPLINQAQEAARPRTGAEGGATMSPE